MLKIALAISIVVNIVLAFIAMYYADELLVMKEEMAKP